MISMRMNENVSLLSHFSLEDQPKFLWHSIGYDPISPKFKVSIKAFISLLSQDMCKMTPGLEMKYSFISYEIGKKEGKLPLQSDQVQSSLLMWNSRARRSLRVQWSLTPPVSQWGRRYSENCQVPVSAAHSRPRTSPGTTHYYQSQMLAGEPKTGSEGWNELVHSPQSVQHNKHLKGCLWH